MDGQLDSVQLREMKIELDPYDLPPGKFLSAGQAWQLCQASELDPDRCGIGDLHGLWFVRDNVVRDFMALNRLELLPWDRTMFMDKRHEELTGEERRLFDRLADLTAVPGDRFGEIQSLNDEAKAFFQMPTEWQP